MGKTTAEKRAQRTGDEVFEELVAHNTREQLKTADDSDLFYTDTAVSGRKRPRSESTGAKIYVRPAKAPRQVSEVEAHRLEKLTLRKKNGENIRSEPEVKVLTVDKAKVIADNPLDARRDRVRKFYTPSGLDLWADTDVATAKRPRLTGKPAKSVSLSQAVAGMSYHPSFEDHQQLLADEVRKEEQRLAAEAALDKAASFGKRVELPHITDVGYASSGDDDDASESPKTSPLASATAAAAPLAQKRKRLTKGAKRHLAEAKEAEELARIEDAAKQAEAAKLALAERVEKTADTTRSSKAKVNRGASGRDTLSVPLSEDLHGSLRLMQAVSSGAVVVDSLKALVDTGAVAAKRKTHIGRDTGKKRYRMVEFPRKAYELPTSSVSA